jgi:acyl dehydratase
VNAEAKSTGSLFFTNHISTSRNVSSGEQKQMELDARFVGARLRPYQIDVDRRMTTNFAAATGDRNPLYLDDRQEDGLIAPPMLAVALTWPVSSNLGNYLPADDFPSDVLLTQVHYSEKLDIHRLIRPGDRLTINGQLAGILPHRAGTHCVMRYRASDPEGAPVFTEHIGVMLRGVTCQGEGRDLNLPDEPQGNWESVPLWRRKIHIDPLLPYVYDGCSGIDFAIHTSPAFATAMGLPGIILQGTCTLALAARELIHREADADPARLKSLSCRFSGMVRPGSDISVDLLSKDENHFFFEVVNQEGEKAVSRGYAQISG